MFLGSRLVQRSAVGRVSWIPSHSLSVDLTKLSRRGGVDTNKGDDRSPDVRCRLVAKKVKQRNRGGECELLRFYSTFRNCQTSDLGSHDTDSASSQQLSAESELHLCEKALVL